MGTLKGTAVQCVQSENAKITKGIYRSRISTWL